MTSWKMRDRRTGMFSTDCIDAGFDAIGRTFTTKVGAKGTIFHYVCGFRIDGDGVRRFHQRRRHSQALLDLIASWEVDEGPSTPSTSSGTMRFSTGEGSSDDRGAGPFIVDGGNVNSRLRALIKRATERGDELHTTHPVLAQVWRDPTRQANLARAVRHFEINPLDESRSIGRRSARSGTSDVVDAHLAGMAERLGTFVLTGDPDDMTALNARFETY